MGQVTHVLLTRSRLCPGPKPGSSLHLHVLSTPPAFVLSQDQTLREELLLDFFMRVVMTWFASRRTQCRLRVMTSIGYSPLGFPRGKTWTYNGSREIRGTHAVEFSKTVAPLVRGVLPLVDAQSSEALRYAPTR